MSTCFQDIQKACDICINISVRMCEGIPDTCLCSKVDYYFYFIFLEDLLEPFVIFKFLMEEVKFSMLL